VQRVLKNWVTVKMRVTMPVPLDLVGELGLD